MSKALFNQIKKAHEKEKNQEERNIALEEKGVEIGHFGDDDDEIEIKRMDTFLDIAKGIDAEITAHNNGLRIESEGIILFIDPECGHMEEMEGRIFKIIR